MIASPSDVDPERAVAREVIYDWNNIHSLSNKFVLLPVGWETHTSPELGSRPQDLINDRVLHECDLLVGIFWTRLGTPTGESTSGTVEEIERHLEMKKPAMLYFSDQPVALKSVDAQQYDSLLAFKEKCKARGLIQEFTSRDDFKTKFARELQIALQTNPQLKALMAPTVLASAAANPVMLHPDPVLSREAKILLKEASKNPRALIIKQSTLDGVRISANTKPFVGATARESASWEDGLQELVRWKLVEPQGTKGQIYKVTRRGFDMADLIADAQ
jgi:hypothetical protein